MAAKCNVSSESVTLTARQLAAVDALLTSGNVTAVAEQVGVSRKTIHSWQRQPAFQGEIRAGRRRLVEVATGVLTRHVEAAAKVLLAVMGNTSTPPATRVAAAKTVLDFALRTVEVEEFAARLDALEAASEGSA